MSDDGLFGGRYPREDVNETFPPRLSESTAPALLGEMSDMAPLLVAGHLLRLAARQGGSRIRPGEVSAALKKLERAVAPEIRAHCADEARRVAEWIERPPPAPAEPRPRDDVDVLEASGVRSRLAVARWALEDDLDLEIEWYDEANDRWPRYRAHPLGVDDTAGDQTLVVRVGGDEVTIPVVHIRWLMPVEPSERDPVEPDHGARVITFPGPNLSEE